MKKFRKVFLNLNSTTLHLELALQHLFGSAV
jgi:hypothetical protein